METLVKKRDGRIVDFNENLICAAVNKCVKNTDPNVKINMEPVLKAVRSKITADIITVEQIQDIVESELMKQSSEIAKSYILYRNKRNVARDFTGNLTQTLKGMMTSAAKDMNLMRENANINADVSMGVMLRIGSEASKDFSLKYLIKPEYAELYKDGDIHIHDLDFYPICFNCCQIPLGKMLRHGFNTGHGHVNQPHSIITAAALACIVLQSNQNEMFGGQSFPCWEYDLAPYVAKTFAKKFTDFICDQLEDTGDDSWIRSQMPLEKFDNIYNKHHTILSSEAKADIRKMLKGTDLYSKFHSDYFINKAFERATFYTERDVSKAMKAVIHNLNTMQSRCLPADEKVVTLRVKNSRDIDKMSDVERDAFKSLIEDLYESMTIEAVASELNIGLKVMNNIFKKLNIKIRNKKETAEFMKARWVEKYGVDNPAKNPEILKKIKETQFKKYGCYAFNSEKQKQTMIERYGTENCMQNENVKNKLFNNNIKKYGCKCTLQTPETIEKSKKTCIEKYGVYNVLCKDSSLRPSNIGFDKNPESNIKAHKTLQEKYGGSGMGSPEIKQKIAETCLEKYGYVTYPVYKDSYGLHESKGQIELCNIIKNNYPNINVMTNQRGLLLENEGLEIDIWIPQLRIGIEYNGDYWHNRELYENDIINNTVDSRERIKDILAINNNITLIQVWESDFKSNKKNVLDYIFNIIDKHFED